MPEFPNEQLCMTFAISEISEADFLDSLANITQNVTFDKLPYLYGLKFIGLLWSQSRFITRFICP